MTPCNAPTINADPCDACSDKARCDFVNDHVQELCELLGMDLGIITSIGCMGGYGALMAEIARIDGLNYTLAAMQLDSDQNKLTVFIWDGAELFYQFMLYILRLHATLTKPDWDLTRNFVRTSIMQTILDVQIGKLIVIFADPNQVHPGYEQPAGVQ